MRAGVLDKQQWRALYKQHSLTCVFPHLAWKQLSERCVFLCWCEIWLFLPVVPLALACIHTTNTVGRESLQKFLTVQQIAAPPQNLAVTRANSQISRHFMKLLCMPEYFMNKDIMLVWLQFHSFTTAQQLSSAQNHLHSIKQHCVFTVREFYLNKTG